MDVPFTEEEAMKEVLRASHRHISAARDEAGYNVWQGLSWAGRYKVLQSIPEPPPPPSVRPITELPAVSLHTEVGLYGTRDKLLYSEAVNELHAACVALQDEKPPVLPDHHLVGQGRRPRGVRYPLYHRVCYLVFDAIREDEVSFVWEMLMNPHMDRVADAQTASVEQLRQLLDTQAVHRAVATGDLLSAIGRATISLKQDLVDAGRNPESHELRAGIDAAESTATRLRSDLESAELLALRLRREIARHRGSLPGGDIDAAIGSYHAGHTPFTRGEFLTLCDLACPGLRRTAAMQVWSDVPLGDDAAADLAQATQAVLEAGRLQMCEPEDLARRIHRAERLGLGNAAAAEPDPKAPLDAPARPRQTLSDVLARREMENSAAAARLTHANSTVAELQEELQRVQALLEADEARAAELELSKLDPTHPPPEVPAALWVVVSGGWAEAGGPRGAPRPRPGRFGPSDRIAGKYTLVAEEGDGGTPEWERAGGREGEEPPRIVGGSGVWQIVAGDGAVAEQGGVHNGWRPHEVEAPWGVVGDVARLWGVLVSAEEQLSYSQRGLCRTCGARQGILCAHIRKEEGDRANLRGDIAAVDSGTAQLERGMCGAFSTMLLHQDAVESPPMRDPLRKWGTEGEFSGDPDIPLWTGGRPQGDYALHRLPYPESYRRGEAGALRDSRMSAVYRQLDGVRGFNPAVSVERAAPATYPVRLPTVQEQWAGAAAGRGAAKPWRGDPRPRMEPPPSTWTTGGGGGAGAGKNIVAI